MTIITRIVRNRWLINAPVIERWVVNWVSNLNMGRSWWLGLSDAGNSHSLSVNHKCNIVVKNWVEVRLMLDNSDVIWTNFQRHAKTGWGHLVGGKHRFWVDVNWDTSFLKLNVVIAVDSIDDNISESEINISSLIFQKFWLNKHWNSINLQNHFVLWCLIT